MTDPEERVTDPAGDDSRRLTMFELARLEEARRNAAAVDVAVRRSASTTREVRKPAWLVYAALLVVTATAVLRLYKPVEELAAERRFEREIGAAADGTVPPELAVTGAGYGKSRNVLVRVAMPGQVVEYPLAMRREMARYSYQWVRAADASPADAPRPIGGVNVLSPRQPGLYRLALVPRSGGGAPQVLEDITLAVLVPFAQKVGGVVNGYRIGAYPFERFGGERPLGFLEIDRRNVDLPLTRHLKVADFVTHDAQQSRWPKYAVVSPRLLDKLELVVDEVARIRGVPDPLRISVDVHSGFRTPLHNRGVEGSALNSRHQYGDAADVAIDADGDGRFTSFDSRLVALAAEMVEKRHPEMVGGLGVYVSAKYRTPYVHIDARGKRARWWG